MNIFQKNNYKQIFRKILLIFLIFILSLAIYLFFTKKLESDITLNHIAFDVYDFETISMFLKEIFNFKENKILVNRPNIKTKNFSYSRGGLQQINIHLTKAIPNKKYENWLHTRIDAVGPFHDYSDFTANHFALRIHSEEKTMNVLNKILRKKNISNELLEKFPNKKINYYGPIKLSNKLYQLYVEFPEGQILEIQLLDYDKLRKKYKWLPIPSSWNTVSKKWGRIMAHHHY